MVKNVIPLLNASQQVLLGLKLKERISIQLKMLLIKKASRKLSAENKKDNHNKHEKI